MWATLVPLAMGSEKEFIPAGAAIRRSLNPEGARKAIRALDRWR
jgi:hypothetical protein